MPKERKDRSVSFDRSRVSPFHCSSSSSRNKHSLSIKPSESIQEIKEWEEARCPVCMEHPHNAVLLLCSSHDKGCHPYMCDTSYRHSNCLDQFRKAFGAESATNAESASNPQDSSPDSSNSAWLVNAEERHLLSEQLDGGELQAPSTLIPCNGLDLPKLSCPLCRGHIKGWIVEEPARKFMNAKIRSCSSESCPFNGTYTDLRKHARVEHPLARPSEVDQERQRNWRRLERQRDLGDVLSTIQSALGGGEDNRALLDDEIPIPIVGDDGGWLTVYFLVRVFRPPGQSWSTVPSRLRGMARSRRRMSLWGESYDDVESATREEDNNTNNDDEGLEEMSSSWHRRVRSQRRTTPENDEG